MASQKDVGFLIFDVEAVGDGELIGKVKYSGLPLTPTESLRKFRDELIEQTGRDVLPPTFVLPISVAVIKVSKEFELLDVAVLDDPHYRPHVITQHFWQGWRHYGRPTLVTFNGRGYDLPVLELAAYRYGISLPDWFNTSAPAYEQFRNRYNKNSHLDLMDLFGNFGATRMTGGLNLLANLIGKPGKTGVDGSQVQDMYDAGQVREINDYCRADVLDTYFVFLRTRVLLGQLTLEREQELVDQTRAWLEEKKTTFPAFAHYLSHWGDWTPPTEVNPSE
ncbi:3'-5' exonuclease [Planctomicrobium sp. SH668]|uniref:3'-5' exonuclease n=1 Tax=Planctomicrobium sp. SH668 TaxID=3448126 RepID=UPI003F5AE38F